MVALVEVQVLWGSCPLSAVWYGRIRERIEEDRTKMGDEVSKQVCDGGGLGGQVVLARSG